VALDAGAAMTSDSESSRHAAAPALGAEDVARGVAALAAAAESAAARDERGTRPALGRFALVASFVGRFDDAARYARLLAERARRDGDAAHLAHAELALGMRALFLGEHAEARARLDRARARGTSGNTGPVAYATAAAAELALYGGDDAGAEALALAAVDAAGRAGDRLAGACGLTVAGVAAARLGRVSAARERLHAALAAAIDARDARSQLRAIEAIGLLESDPPGAATALRLLAAAGRHRRRLGLARPRELARRLELREGELRYTLGDSPFEEGTHAGSRLSIADAIALARAGGA